MSLKDKSNPVNIQLGTDLDKSEIMDVKKIYCSIYKCEFIRREYYKPIVKLITPLKSDEYYSEINANS